MANIATKEQERKALDKIRKIIEELGENSYIGTAFEGCIEDAEDNIKNDWAMSMKDRWQSAEQTIEKQKAKVKRLYEEDEAKAEKIKRLHEAQCDMETQISDLRSQVKALESKLQMERKDITVETTDGNTYFCEFNKLAYFQANESHPFSFVNVIEKSGWVNSYKMEDIRTLEIQ